jgi:lipopolysaccharide transport system permease protein
MTDEAASPPVDLPATRRRTAQAEIVITPPTGLGALSLREIYDARYLLWNLVRREARTPYLDLSFGVFWTLVRPLLFVFVFLFIRRASNADMKTGVEYTLYVYTGVTMWWYFVDATTAATNSIFKDASLITKIYYPRMISPIAPVIARLKELSTQALLYPVGMIAFAHYPDWHIVLLPLVVLQFILMALALGFFTAALAARSQDFLSVQRYVLYIGMFLSPVIYSPELLTERFQGLYYALNPLAAPLEMLRVALFSGVPAPWTGWGISAGFTLAALAGGIVAFRRMEAQLADTVQ